MANTTFSGPVISDNGFVVPTYTVTDALALSSKTTTGLMIFVSDATNGGGGTGSIAISNGTTFIDASTGAEVA